MRLPHIAGEYKQTADAQTNKKDRNRGNSPGESFLLFFERWNKLGTPQ